MMRTVVEEEDASLVVEKTGDAPKASRFLLCVSAVTVCYDVEQQTTQMSSCEWRNSQHVSSSPQFVESLVSQIQHLPDFRK